MSPAMKPKADSNESSTSNSRRAGPSPHRGIYQRRLRRRQRLAQHALRHRLQARCDSNAIMPMASGMARGIVRAGLRVSPEMLSPDSMPTKAKNRMSVASPNLPAVGSPLQEEVR